MMEERRWRENKMPEESVAGGMLKIIKNLRSCLKLA